MDLRKRNCTGTIKIGVVELYSNCKEDAIRPFQMDTNINPSYLNHADNVIKIIKHYVPNAQIHLVPNTTEGLRYLINQGIKLVNISLKAYASPTMKELSSNAFIVIAAGNDGDKGESSAAQMIRACCVGAVNSNLQPQSYSSYGNGTVKTVAITGVTDYTGVALHGTSFAAPVVTGLLAQYFVWFNSVFGKYPSIKHANRFVVENSHDVFEDSFDLRTGYGLFRLPKEFKQNVIEITDKIVTGVVKKYLENGNVETSPIQLLAVPFIQNGRMMASITDIGDFLSLTIDYDAQTRTGIFID